MSYITSKTKTVLYRISCSHPKVERIWDFGFMSADPSIEPSCGYGIWIITTDSEVNTFRGNTPEEAKRKAEYFLNSLSH